MSEVTIAALRKSYDESCARIGKEKTDAIVRDFVEEFDGDLDAIPADEMLMIDAALSRGVQQEARAKLDTRAIWAKFNSAGKRDSDFNFG